MKKIILFLLTVTLFLPGCDDYLDAVPDKDIITLEGIFEKRETADEWVSGAYYFLFFSGHFSIREENVGICGADELVGSEAISHKIASFSIADGLQMSQNPYCDIWEETYYYIRYCNTFLDNIDNVYNMEEWEKKEWSAEIKALKAFYYFELVRRYGPIVLVPENIGVNASLEQMRQPRSHVDTCFKVIVDLLEEAIPILKLDADKELLRRAFFSKEAAMALKARVLLYAASPLFNGNEFYANFKGKDGELFFSAEYDPERWKLAAEAADEAVRVCETLGYQLIQGSVERLTLKRNTMRDIELSVWADNWQSLEAIFMVKRNVPFYRNFLPRLDSKDNIYNSSAYGDMAVNMKLVEMFYTENGLPIDKDKTWDYAGRYGMKRENSSSYQGVVALGEEVLSLHLGREPRFYANVAADRCYWRMGPMDVTDNLLVRAYRGERFGFLEDRVNPNFPQNLTGYWAKKLTRSELGLKNYIESSLGETTSPIIRLAELYLIQAEAWNEYLGPNKEKVFAPLNKVRERAGIPDVETSWISYSKEPNKINTKEGVREIIHREKTIEFAFEGHRFWDLRRWKKAHLELNTKPTGWNVLGTTPREFFNNHKGPRVVWDKVGFRSPRDYLFPIKAGEVMISGYVQNPGW